jgi:poly(beta-D-mannuronate) lyase
MNRFLAGLAGLLLLQAGALALAAAEAASVRVTTAVELQAAAAQARPGTVVVLADGVWRDADLRVVATGTAAEPVTVRAETPGGVVLSGRSRLRLAGSYVEVKGLIFRDGGLPDQDVIEFRGDSRSPAEHCRLSECAIVDYNAAVPDRDTRWVSLYGRQNRVDHCRFSGKTNGGATLVVWVSTSPNEHRIDHNLFGPRPPLGKNGGETIRIGTSDVSMHESQTVVEFNLFDACNGEIEIVSNKSCGNLYRHNTFLRCEGTLTLRHGNRCTVAGNWFLGQGTKSTGGVRVIGEDHRVVNNYFAELTGTGARSALSFMQGIPDSPLSGYFQVKRAAVLFNTVVNCRSPLEVGVKGDKTTLPPVDCAVANNVISGSQGPLVRLTAVPAGWTWQGNVAWGAVTGLPAEPGVRELDPQLSRDDTGIWRPLPESPLRGAAAGAFPDVSEDIDGQPRPESKDVGCDQLSPTAPPFRPLTPDAAGPSWAEKRAAAE